jgi:hypothetical protein
VRRGETGRRDGARRQRVGGGEASRAPCFRQANHELRGEAGLRSAREARLLRAAVAGHGLNVAWVSRQRTFSNSMKSMISSRLLFCRLTRCDGAARLRGSSECLRASSARMRTSSARSMARARSSSGSQAGLRCAGQPAAAGRGRAAPCAAAAGRCRHQSAPAELLSRTARRLPRVRGARTGSGASAVRTVSHAELESRFPLFRGSSLAREQIGQGRLTGSALKASASRCSSGRSAASASGSR